MLKLFRIYLTNVGYDDYDSAIVAAESLSQVKDLCEYGNSILDEDFHTYEIGKRFKNAASFERRSYQKYTVEEIGTTKHYTEPTIVLSSFNAG